MASQKSVGELEQLLREALQRAEEAEKEGQKERRRAEEAEEAQQKERRRADEEQQRANGERQRADGERQRAEASEEQTRSTTLDEYLAACHDLVFSRLSVEPIPKPTTKKSTVVPITNPHGKWCPTNIKPWSNFIMEQRLTFGLLNNTFPTENRVFENRNFLTVLGGRVSQRQIADEKALEYFLHFSVEDPVRAIIHKLKEVEEVAAAFEIGDGVVFENHMHALGDTAEEVVEREMETSSTPQTPDHRQGINHLRPDQICVSRSKNRNTPFEQRTLVYISEYKSPCKLTAPHLRVGLRPMNIHKEVVNRKTIPTSADPDGNFRYHAEKLTASAITQTYHYMIESGLEYGNLTTGEATVFLKIDWNEPETLYYHLAEPKYEVSAHPNSFHTCTAVGQYLAFTLMALGSPGEQRLHGQEERLKAMDKLKTWAEDFETTLRSIPENERSASSDDSPCYKPTTYDGVDRSPYLLRGRRRVTEKQSNKTLLRKDGRRDSSDDEFAKPPDTPTPTGRSRGQATRRSKRLAQRPRGGGHEQSRQYCTQKCLLGLVTGGFLDLKCPNVALHRKKYGARARHPVSHVEWLGLLWKQLERSLDDGITRLGQSGARGVLFKVTLLAYGYTFVGKGTVRAFIEDLTHEAAVYDRLKPIQGLYVPVFLGAIDLRSMNKTYYYLHRVYVVHMTFLSWGGVDLDDALEMGNTGKYLESMTVTALRAIHQSGVIHGDVRCPNMLFNREVNRVMMIDFERASLLEPPRLPLTQSVLKKRKWRPEEKECKNTGISSYNARQARKGFAKDIFYVSIAFYEPPSPPYIVVK